MKTEAELKEAIRVELYVLLGNYYREEEDDNDVEDFIDWVWDVITNND